MHQFVMIGIIISGLGSLIGLWFVQKGNSLSNSEKNKLLNEKIDAQKSQVEALSKDNKNLLGLVDNLNIKATEQSKTILDLTKQNSDLSLQLAKSTENLFGNITF